MDNQKDIVIELKGVTKDYNVESQVVPALRGVDLKVRKGDMVAVTGTSGSGKSTILHMIGTLDQPTEGKVFLNGANVTEMTDQTVSSFRNSTIGFVFQMNNLLPEFSALENVMMPGLIAGVSKSAVKEKASLLLKAVGLSHRENHRPGEMSGGEQQRVAIARALLMDPPIILADEPTGNLDKKTSSAIQELLLQLCKDNSITMLLVTHDLSLAQKFENRVVMEDGKIVETIGLEND